MRAIDRLKTLWRMRTSLRETAARPRRGLLRRSGFEVTSYATPEAALTAARAGARPNLLITDVVMPQFSGPEVAAQLCSMIPDLRVLYVSGYPDERVDRAWLSGSGSACLAKPFSGVELNNAIAELLQVDSPSGCLPDVGGKSPRSSVHDVTAT